MAIQLLLLEDVESLGRSGDVVKVKPGYARNYLLPKGFALVANKAALRRQEKLKQARIEKALADRKESEAVVAKLEAVLLETTVKVDEEGHMYGSVSAADLSQLLESKGITLEKKAFQLKSPIKKLGEHSVEIKLNEGVETTIKVLIEAEEKEL